LTTSRPEPGKKVKEGKAKRKSKKESTESGDGYREMIEDTQLSYGGIWDSGRYLFDDADGEKEKGVRSKLVGTSLNVSSLIESSSMNEDLDWEQSEDPMTEKEERPEEKGAWKRVDISKDSRGLLSAEKLNEVDAEIHTITKRLQELTLIKEQGFSSHNIWNRCASTSPLSLTVPLIYIQAVSSPPRIA